jgi:hypothetical protein
LKVFLEMPATVIAERIGWQRGPTVLKVRVRELRSVFRPPDPDAQPIGPRTSWGGNRAMREHEWLFRSVHT